MSAQRERRMFSNGKDHVRISFLHVHSSVYRLALSTFLLVRTTSFHGECACRGDVTREDTIVRASVPCSCVLHLRLLASNSSESEEWLAFAVVDSSLW